MTNDDLGRDEVYKIENLQNFEIDISCAHISPNQLKQWQVLLIKLNQWASIFLVSISRQKRETWTNSDLEQTRQKASKLTKLSSILSTIDT